MSINRKTPKVNRSRFRREWGCPLTKNRTPWCFMICVPEDGEGACGRIAPHSLSGRTLDALRKHERESRLEALREKTIQAAQARRPANDA